MKLNFENTSKPPSVTREQWLDWRWQMRSSLEKASDFSEVLSLSASESEAFAKGHDLFRVRATPYYLSLLSASPRDPLRKILIPTNKELLSGRQQMLDPLNERNNNPAPRIIHRYPDRALFLVTDFCSVYCRYCTRKHFTGQEQTFPSMDEYALSLEYLRSHPGIREVILSGGDPLTLGDAHLDRVLSDLRDIEHIEIIRIGTRMPVVCPMRVTPELGVLLKKHKPVYVMTHFNHPKELTREAADALELLADSGVPLFNQMVLLREVNNHPVLVQALSRRLLYLRVKPYYAFQCDPSEGTDHLRTSVKETLDIQKELWGNLSGLAMPHFALDIPGGGGKVPLVPEFEKARRSRADGSEIRDYEGWDQIAGSYVDPAPADAGENSQPEDWKIYAPEWELTKNAKGSC